MTRGLCYSQVSHTGVIRHIVPFLLQLQCHPAITYTEQVLQLGPTACKPTNQDEFLEVISCPVIVYARPYQHFQVHKICCSGQQSVDQPAGEERITNRDAVWVYDIAAHAWSQQRTSGDSPNPYQACSMAVFGDCAYLLVNNAPDKCLKVFELDLKKWVWRCLPTDGPHPHSDPNATATVVQVSCRSCSL